MFSHLRLHVVGILLIALTNSYGVAQESPPPVKNVAAVVTAYYPNSHADVLVSRILEGYALDGKRPGPNMRLAALYVDQFPANDMSRAMSQKHRFPIASTIDEALTLGTGRLAVDGVLIVAEHGSYPLSETEQTEYPKRRMFGEVADVFKKSGRVVPVFCDKHLADNWADARWMFDTARNMKVPLMAGSSLPSYRREPAANVEQGRPVKEIVAVAYGPVEAYGFHGLEMLQCLAERRKGGETGVRSVRYLEGQSVWDAGHDNAYDARLLKTAVGRAVENFESSGEWREKVTAPSVFIIEYNDGLRASVFLLSGLTDQFAAAWQYADDNKIKATRFALQDGRPYMHFAYLLRGIDDMMQTGQPSWPPERTLLTTGMLHAAMLSKTQGQKPMPTTHLDIRYHSSWDWEQPPAP